MPCCRGGLSVCNYNLGLPHRKSRPPTDILRLIAKNLTEMVMAYDMNRKLVFVNPAV
jgi:hypothetical protein